MATRKTYCIWWIGILYVRHPNTENSVSLHHRSRYRPCSALKGFVCGCSVTVNSSHLNRPPLGHAAFLETEPSSAEKLWKSYAREKIPFVWALATGCGASATKKPFLCAAFSRVTLNEAALLWGRCAWLAPPSTNQRAPQRPPLLPVSNQNGGSPPRHGLSARLQFVGAVQVFEVAGVPPTGRVTRNTGSSRPAVGVSTPSGSRGLNTSPPAI